jgi:hypothetical protein
MASTSEMRAAWAPACDGGGMETISFGSGGARITVDRVTVPIWRAVEAIFAKHRYPIRQADTGAYNCRQITGGSGYSLHAYGIAVDVNWQSNPYGPNLVTDMPPAAIREIEALEASGQPAVRWGGRYSGNKDAMHFEVIVPPAVAARFTYDQGGLTVAEIDQLIDVIQRQGELTRQKIESTAERVITTVQNQGKLTRDKIAAQG